MGNGRRWVRRDVEHMYSCWWWRDEARVEKGRIEGTVIEAWYAAISKRFCCSALCDSFYWETGWIDASDGKEVWFFLYVPKKTFIFFKNIMFYWSHTKWYLNSVDLSSWDFLASGRQRLLYTVMNFIRPGNSHIRERLIRTPQKHLASSPLCKTTIWRAKRYILEDTKCLDQLFTIYKASSRRSHNSYSTALLVACAWIYWIPSLHH